MTHHTAVEVLKSLCSILVLLQATPALATQPDTPKVYAHVEETEGYIPFAFAISGGISLGSYEAGMNWALLNYQKSLRDDAARGNNLPPKLMAVTGASAGGINALMTGLSWCMDPQKTRGTEFDDTIDNNLFKQMWLDVGFDNLLPKGEKPHKDDKETEKGDGQYKPDDGLLTRKAFKKVLKKLKSTMNADIYIQGCRVPIGLMVTRTKPLVMSVDGVDGLKVENERFIIPVLLSVDETGKARFKANILNSDVAGLGNTIYLAGSGERDTDGLPVIDNESVISAVLASSAFPVAFGRVQLDYCMKRGREDHGAGSLKDDSLCPGGYSRDSADFVDGGLFDNIPLGAAKALGEPHRYDSRSRKAWLSAGRRVNYLYIDPDHRRGNAAKRTHAAGETDKRSEQKTYGLRSQLGFLSGAITTGRNYELYKTMQSGDWTRQAPLFALRHVIPAIDKKIVSKKGTITSQNEAPTADECAALYKGLAEHEDGEPDVEALQTARRCLRAEAQRLEGAYLPFLAAGTKPLTNREVIELRAALIDHMHLLARKIDEQLDLDVQMIANDKLGDRRVLLSTRFFPITGNYLFYFGAFMDRPLRDFDYYAGIYDSVHDLADYACEVRSSNHTMEDYVASQEKCISERAQEIYGKLAIRGDSRADTVFRFLAGKEHGPSWKWLDSYTPPSEDRNLTVIGTSLEKTEQSGATEGGDTKKGKESEFEIFIRDLAHSGYIPSASSTDMQWILNHHDKDESLWYYPLTSRASERLLQLEDAEYKAKDNGWLLKKALSLGALAVNTYVHDEKRLTLSPSSAPDGAWQNILPYEAFFDVKNGGLAFSWEPRLHVYRDLFLGLKATPIGYNKFGNDWIWFTQGDLYAMYNEQNNLYSFGIGPTVNSTWDTWPGHKRVNYGAALFGGLFNKMRVTLGLRSFERGGFGGDNLYIQLGVTDIPGFAYWPFK
jgi:predicted acylesterase/phospholipase RssA